MTRGRRSLRRSRSAVAAAAILVASALMSPAARGATAPPAAAAGADLRVEVAPGPYTVGDRIEVTLSVTVPGPPGTQPRFPAWGETWGEAEIVESSPPRQVEAAEVEAADSGGSRTEWRQRLILAGFRPGRLELPPREIAVPLGETVRLSTPAGLAVEIASVLPAAAGDDGAEEIPPPRPPAPPRDLPYGAAFWWTLAAGLGLLAALAWLAAARRRQAAVAAAAARALPPLEELERSLAAARGAASPIEALAGVSLALRRFLGRTLGFPAAESTTSEVHRQLLARHLPTGLPRRAVDLLRACDLVKFARQPAPDGAVDRWAGEAGGIGREVERHLRPPEPEAATEARQEAA